MNPVKKYQINILDESFTILSDEPEKDVNDSLNLMYSFIKEISEKSGISDSKKIILLAALKLSQRTVALEADKISFHEQFTKKDKDLTFMIEDLKHKADLMLAE